MVTYYLTSHRYTEVEQKVKKTEELKKRERFSKLSYGLMRINRMPQWLIVI